METPRFTGEPRRDAAMLKKRLGGSADVIFREMLINGAPAAGLYLDGMCDEMRILRAVTGPLTNKNTFTEDGRTAEQIRLFAYKGADMKETDDPEEAAALVTAGHFALLLPGLAGAFLFGAQGYPRMGVEEAKSEQNELGGREGFTDTLKDNLALLRRKLRTPDLAIEQITVGRTCPAAVALCYLPKKTDPGVLEKVRLKLTRCGAETALGSGWLRPFLNGRRPALFPATGVTERPDVLAYKLSVGRIGVLVDGSPFAIIVPYLFTDSFHAPDDYATGTVYAGFVRLLRALCFLTAVALPGLFVAVCDFHPNMLPSDVMFKIASAEAQTPFPLALEAVTIHLIYEAVREAGLRMPKAAGHTVSIVGALVIGDAAVKAGLIAAPMLIIVALTTVCSAVVSNLQDRTVLLRLLLIAAGSAAGFFGVFLGLGLIAVEICAVSPYGVPLSAPLSPYEKKGFGNGLFRRRMQLLARERRTLREEEF